MYSKILSSNRTTYIRKQKFSINMSRNDISNFFLRVLDANQDLKSLYPRIDNVQRVLSTYNPSIRWYIRDDYMINIRLIREVTYDPIGLDLDPRFYLRDLMDVAMITYGTNAQSAYHKWFTECLFRLLDGKWQCYVVFSNLAHSDNSNNPDPRIQLRHGLIEFLRYADLFVLIDSFNYDIDLDCDLTNPNVLGSIICNDLHLDNDLYVDTYNSYLAFVLALCVKINILSISYDGSVFTLNTRRASRNVAAMNERLRKVVQHIYSPQWEHYESQMSSRMHYRDHVTDIINAYDGHQFRRRVNNEEHDDDDEYDNEEETMRDIELVDYSVYTAPVQRGVTSIELYETFFEQACSASSAQLQALRRIVSSYASAMSLSVTDSILSTQDGICKWLQEEQRLRTRECVNQTEPFTQANVSDIPLLFLWKHRTKDDYVQCYDLLSLRDYVKANPVNPLTRDRFEADEITKIDNQYQLVTGLMQVVFNDQVV